MLHLHEARAELFCLVYSKLAGCKNVLHVCYEHNIWHLYGAFVMLKAFSYAVRYMLGSVVFKPTEPDKTRI